MSWQLPNETPQEKADRQQFFKDYARYQSLKTAADLEIINVDDTDLVFIATKVKQSFKAVYLQFM